MAKNKYKKESYYITYSCGHEVKEIIGGYTQEYRDEEAEKRSKYLCSDCEREKEIKKAEANMEKYELPELVGTPRQIDWAMQIRDNKLERILNYKHEDYTSMDFNLKRRIKKDDRILESGLIEEAKARLLQNTKSTFWIDNRDAFISTLIVNEIDKILEEEIEKEFKEIDQEIASEQIVRPDNFNGDIVNIKSSNEIITIESPKRDDIIELVKSKGYVWRDNSWKKRSTPENLDNRLAEIGNLLLLKGYGVRFNTDNSEILMDKAINGDFEPEQTRWVGYDDDSFYVAWYGYNDDLYKTARSLPGSRWDGEKSAVSIPVINYNELLDFADFNGFKLTEKAEKVIAELKSNESARETIKKSSNQADEIVDILNSSREVLDDLKDED